jgi:hypothetical protein
MDIQAQVQDKMQEMLADRLMSNRNEMFHDITAGDSFLTQDIIAIVCSRFTYCTSGLSDMQDRIIKKFISALGPSYESYCQQLVLDDIAKEEAYQKECAIEQDEEQRMVTVTHEMAMDAQDMSLEGQRIKW